MNASQIFQIVNPLAGMAWILLIVIPNWKYTKLITSVILPALIFAGIYVFSLGLSFGHSEGGFGSLEEVRTLFANDNALLAGWIHYLAFDLFVGTWEMEDSQKNGISRFIVAPCMFLTFMFGPTGLLCYTVIKLILKKNLSSSINIK